jgi:hypothetical protein
MKEGLIQKREIASFLKQLLDPNRIMKRAKSPEKSFEWVKL